MTSRSLVFAIVLAPVCAAAQNAPHDLSLVMPHGPGRIAVRLAEGFHPSNISLYDDNTRPVLGTVNEKNGLDVSYILFPNGTGAPTSESCRDAVVSVILKNLHGNSTLQNVSSTTRTLKNGKTVAVGSFFTELAGRTPLHQQSLFAFSGDKNTCAEIHISRANSGATETKLLDEALEQFDFDLNYTPTAVDYGSLAGIFYEQAHDMKSAAPYYDSALNALDGPIAGFDARTMRRVLTDQLSMSYGMSGDLKRSREVNEAAILKDPDYPLYYYNLACADAEAGDAKAAQNHLQQAYDRRANTIKGETMPDASKDDSFLKLKSNKEFWKFVQSLPKS